MKVQTSFHINISNFSKLVRASHRTGKSMIALITEMMYQYARDYHSNEIPKRTVKYQDRDIEEHWKIYRVALDPDDYDLFTDMRKVMKKSVSFIIALAIKKYLDKIVNQLLARSINYTRLLYFAGGVTFNDIKYWILRWKIYEEKPPKDRPRPCKKNNN